jgi:hypothetical protein
MGLIMDDCGDIQLAGAIPSSLPRHDLLLLTGLPQKPTSQQASRRTRSNSLPVSPYPVPIGTAIAAHFIIDKESVHKTHDDGWIPCFNGMMYRKWVKGHVIGYRDFAGNEAKVNIPTCHARSCLYVIVLAWDLRQPIAHVHNTNSYARI